MTDRVSLVGERTIQVTAQSKAILNLLRQLEGTPISGTSTWRINYDSEDELAKILQRLQDADLAFEGGPGWPPADIAVLLREKGKLHGSIREITWGGPGLEILRQI